MKKLLDVGAVIGFAVQLASASSLANEPIAGPNRASALESILQFEDACAGLEDLDDQAISAETAAKIQRMHLACQPYSSNGETAATFRYFGRDSYTEMSEVAYAVRRLKEGDWYLDPDTHYLVFLVMAVSVMALAIVAFEVLFLKSTLFGCFTTTVRNKVTAALKAIRVVKDKPAGPADETDTDLAALTSQECHRCQLYNTGSCVEFWKEVHKYAEEQVSVLKENTKKRHQLLEVKDTIEFNSLDFPSLEAVLKAVVVINRVGSGTGTVEVQVTTCEAKNAGGFKATAGHDFVHREETVVFKDGQMQNQFEIDLLPTDECWLPTRWFYVELKKVVSGQARLGGPSLSRWISDTGPTCRVYIIQDDTFPPGLSEQQVEAMHKGEHDLFALRMYFKDRIKARGRKFWKALAGFCYEPVHAVVVTPLVLSYIIDWGAHKSDGDYSYIIILVCIQFVSSILLRFGDWEQVNNRGRTGGCRNVARQQLLSKLLMMEHPEQYEYNGNQWFYAALNNVESMVSDGYWQIYVMTRSIFALILALLTLIWKAWYKSIKDGQDVHLENFIPALALLMLTPVCFALVLGRRAHGAELIENRMNLEEKWVEIFAWLAEHSRHLYVFGARELACVQHKFTGAQKIFLGAHWKARNFTNDSVWVTKWVGITIYCCILTWAAFRLYHSRREGNVSFTAGDCIILIQVFDKFTKYLGDLSKSFVAMQKGAVSVRKIAQFLTLMEHKSLLTAITCGHMSEFGQVIGGQNIDRDYIVLENLKFEIPHRRQGFGPVGSVQQVKDKILKIPLGKVVYLIGGTESQRASFLKLIAKLLHPSEGTVTLPSDETCITLPAVAIDFPEASVKQDFLLAGASEEVAHNLARAFDLEPDEIHMRLPPGKAAMQALARALLRDPTILLATRPLSTVPREVQADVMNLLLAWQTGGGAEFLVEMLRSAAPKAALAEYKAKREVVERRTLILSGESVPRTKGNKLLDDIFVVDLDPNCDDPYFVGLTVGFTGSKNAVCEMNSTATHLRI